MPTVSGAPKWKPAVAVGIHEWQLGYTCPTCHRQYVFNLQPGGRVAPVVADDEDAAGESGTWGATSPETLRWEARRAAGKVEHVAQPEFTFQMWCYTCEKGADVTIAE